MRWVLHSCSEWQSYRKRLVVSTLGAAHAQHTFEMMSLHWQLPEQQSLSEVHALAVPSHCTPVLSFRRSDSRLAASRRGSSAFLAVSMALNASIIFEPWYSSVVELRDRMEQHGVGSPPQ